MKLTHRPIPLSLLPLLLLLFAWIWHAPLPACAAESPPMISATQIPALAPAPSPAPKATSDTENPPASEGRKAHPISEIFADGLPSEPPPNPSPGPTPAGSPPLVFLPSPDATVPGGATNPGDRTTSFSLTPLPTLSPPLAPTPTPAAAPPLVAVLPRVATPAPVPGAPPAPKTATVVPTASQGHGPVDLNTASAAELAALPGLDINRANLIVAHRKAIGGFRQVEQLREVYGISEKVLLQLMPLVAIGSYTPTTASAITAPPPRPLSSAPPSTPALPVLPEPPKMPNATLGR